MKFLKNLKKLLFIGVMIIPAATSVASCHSNDVKSPYTWTDMKKHFEKKLFTAQGIEIAIYSCSKLGQHTDDATDQYIGNLSGNADKLIFIKQPNFDDKNQEISFSVINPVNNDLSPSKTIIGARVSIKANNSDYLNYGNYQWYLTKETFEDNAQLFKLYAKEEHRSIIFNSAFSQITNSNNAFSGLDITYNNTYLIKEDFNVKKNTISKTYGFFNLKKEVTFSATWDPNAKSIVPNWKADLPIDWNFSNNSEAQFYNRLLHIDINTIFHPHGSKKIKIPESNFPSPPQKYSINDNSKLILLNSPDSSIISKLLWKSYYFRAFYNPPFNSNIDKYASISSTYHFAIYDPTDPTNTKTSFWFNLLLDLPLKNQNYNNNMWSTSAWFDFDYNKYLKNINSFKNNWNKESQENHISWFINNTETFKPDGIPWWFSEPEVYLNVKKTDEIVFAKLTPKKFPIPDSLRSIVVTDKTIGYKITFFNLWNAARGYWYYYHCVRL